MVFFNDERMTMNRLESALASARGVAGESTLLIEADEGTPYGTLMEAYSLAMKAGIREVVLATRPPPVAP